MISFFARHPTASNLLMIVLVATGVLSLRKLRRETFPDFSKPEVEIRIVYRGATAEEVEEVICERVEDALDGVKFVEEVRSDAREGLAIVTVEMEESGDFAAFKDDVETEIAAIDDFPLDVEDPVIRPLGTTDMVLSILVAGPMSPPHLKAYCEDLKRRLQLLDDVSLVTIDGFSDHQFRVELSAAALMQYDLSAAEVADIITRQSVNLPAGTIETKERDILVRFVEERRSTRELEDLVILAAPGGAEVRLRQIAKVTDLFALPEEKVLLGSQRAAILRVEMTKTQDTIRVADAVKAFLEEERGRLPESVELTVTGDMSTLVRSRLELLVKNGWQGLLLVFVTLWLFFSFRLAFWVAAGLPVAFLGAFFFLPMFGFTVNMMTMVGLLLAIGLLMDDAIVIAENIAAHLARGQSSIRAAIDGVNEVKAGVFSSFVTTICVLGPLSVLDGNIGRVLEVVPIVLILVLAVSLIEAFLILPSHLAHSLRRYDQNARNAFRRRFDRVIEGARERLVGRIVDTLLRWRYLVVGCVALLFLAAAGLVVGGVIRFRALPDLEGNVIEARLLMTPGTPLEKTEEVVARISEAAGRMSERLAPLQPDGRDLVETLRVQFNYNRDAFERGAHVATVTVELLDAEFRGGVVDDYLAIWREETGRPADVLSLVYTEPLFGPAGRAIEVRLQGDDLEQLQAAHVELYSWFSQWDGVLNLVGDLRRGKPEVRLRLREGAFGLGLDAAGVARQLRAAFHGLKADEIQIGPESYEIDVRLTDADQSTPADVEYFHFRVPGGRHAPLGAVTEMESGRGWSRIARVDGLRTVTLRGDIDPRLTNVAALMAELERDFLPGFREAFPDVRVGLEGEIDEAEKTQGSMRRAMLVGLLGVFILLSFQFRSYIEPLVVMVAIPLAFIGVIVGHLIMGVDLAMPSVLGFVSLAGIVVNDSILLVIFLKKARAEGQDVLASAAQASRLRFRAILLTSLTTIAGLLPLLAERSLQAQILIPLAISIVFGILASTVLVLFVIPCLYGILGDFGLVEKIGEHDDKSAQ